MTQGAAPRTPCDAAILRGGPDRLTAFAYPAREHLRTLAPERARSGIYAAGYDRAGSVKQTTSMVDEGTIAAFLPATWLHRSPPSRPDGTAS